MSHFTIPAAAAARRHVVLFTKPAVPGRVKTRLAGRLGEERAAALHAAFVRDVVDRLRPGPFRLSVAWALADGVEEPPPAALALTSGETEAPLPWRRQQGGDLGARLHEALAAAAEDADYVAAIGSDHPEIDPVQVDDAFRRLEAGADLALGPVPDGGYFLIALRRAAVQPRLFAEIEWSTETVFATTLERARELDLRAATLPRGYDVDVPEDLDQLIRRLRQRPARCPATRALLSSWGLLSAV